MAFISQLTMALIILGLLAVISIGVVLAIFSKEQKKASLFPQGQNRSPSA